MATILLTGATGQVGSELLKTLAPIGRVVAPGRAEMDMADAESVRIETDWR
jgi:dTDP-4-dehydrorhamnose reductase